MNGSHDNTARISSEERLRRVLETEAVGVLFFDYAGTLIDCNDAFLHMTGYTREQVTSKSLHWRDMTPPEYTAASEEQMQLLEQTGHIGPYEKEYLMADGSRRWMHFTGRDLGDGTISKYVIDITEYKEDEAALRESEKRLQENAVWRRSQREALEAAVNGAPLAESLEPLVRTAVETLGRGARAAFYIVNDDGKRLHHLVGMPTDYAKLVDGVETGPGSRWPAEQFDARDCWSFPINTEAGKFVGTLVIYLSQPQSPTNRDLELASLITNSASIIISRHNESEVRKRAEEALRESEAQLRSLNEQLEERVRDRMHDLQAEVQERRTGEERIKNLLRQLVSAQEQERRRIARELHDTFGQQLAALHMSIEVLRAKAGGDPTVHENIERMREVFDRLNSSVDFLAWELRPPSLDLLGLDAALESYVKEWSQQFGIEAGYEGIAVSGLRLAAEAETNLYRIFQEVLQNIHKHAGADRVNVVFERRDGQAVLIVEDNGKGYDSEDQNDGRGMGLINMRERAALIGGNIEIESQSGEGTTVFVRVPVGENGNR